MSRLLRATPPQPRLGEPTVITEPAVPGTPGQLVVRTYGFAAQARPGYTACRFPLPGWEQQAAFEGATPATQRITSGFLGGSAVAVGDPVIQSVAQSFESVRGVLTSVGLAIRRRGTPIDSAFVRVYSDDPAGGPSATILATSGLVVGSSLSSSFTTPPTYTTFTFANPPEVTGRIWVALFRDGAPDVGNDYSWEGDPIGYPTPEGFIALLPAGSSTWDISNTTQTADAQANFTPFAPQMHYQRRFLGPRPPLVVLPLPSPEVVVTPPNVAVSRRTAAPRRKPDYFLGGPTVLAQPPPVGYAVFVTLTHVRPRRVHSSLPLVIFATAPAVFVAPPLAVYCLQPDRLVRRQRRQLPTTALGQPTVLQTFSGPSTPHVRIRPRPTTKEIQPPATLQPYAVELSETTVRVTLARIRPRPTYHSLTPPQAVRVPSVEQREQTISVRLTRIRPRAQAAHLYAPTTLQTFAAGRVALVRIRPRRVVSALPLVIVSTTPPVSMTVAVTLAHTRPRRTETRVAPPTALQVFTGPTVALTRARPRPTRKTLAPPVVVRVPQVEQREDTITVALVRVRPRPTARTLRGPQALRVFQAGVPTLARIRPRKTRTLLSPPVVVRVPSVEQVEDTVRVTLARIRPRPTAKRLAAPTVLQIFGGPQVTLVHTRPRPTRRFIAAPTALQTFSGPAVHLTRIRPRHVVALLGQPQALQTFQGPRVTTVRTRPRPTARFFTEAVVVRVPSVEQLEDTIRVTLVRARPRPTVKTLAAPTVLQTFPAGKPSLARIRPRPTTKTVGQPTVLRVPSVEQVEQTIRVQIVRTRPRPTTRYLSPPRVVTINPPVVTKITTELVEPRNRRDWPRHFPNQGQRQRLVRETGTTATYQQRDPFIGPRPPQIIDPLPTQRVETITVALVAVRTRRDVPRHTVEHVLGAPTRVIPVPTLQMQTVEAVYLQAVRRRTTDVRRLPHSTLRPPTQVSRTPVVTEITVLGQALHASLDRIPRRPRSFTVEPTVYAQSGEITVALVRARPRQTISRLTAVSYPQIGRIRVTLVHTRPRPQRALLKPPTVVRVPSVEQVEDTVRVALVRVRPRPTVKSLRPPAALQVFTGPQTHLVRIRPRPQRAVLTPPTRLRTFAGPVEAEITVSLVTARPRRLPHSRLTLPTAVLPYIFPPRLQRLTPGRRPAVHVRLSPPTVLRVAPPVDVHATVILVAAKTRQRYRVGRWTLPEILPPPHAALLPKTTGYAVPGGFSDGDAIATATSDGDARAVSAAEGWVAPVAESDGKAVPDATTDGGVL